ncbi:MAG: prephenate dehydratase [Acidobacteriota bacterium]
MTASGLARPGKSGPRVAFQGELGAYSEEALQAYFQGGAIPVPQRDFSGVGRAVASERTDYGLLPIENSLAGSVVGAYDVLAGERLVVVGEVIRPIRHCLLGLAGAAIADLREVISHPVALAQCTRFLSAHPSVEARAVYDTAGAAKQIARRRDPALAALAGRNAARHYGLVVLAEHVEDRPDNQTRFLVIARPATVPRARDGIGARKTALMFETENRPGALVEVLRPFADRKINLTKLESRPGTEPWTYRFFLEIEIGVDDAAGDAIEEARRRTRLLRVLGSYPPWTSE